MFSPVIWWTIVGVGLMLLELAIPGLVLFFFGLGALFTALFVWLLPMPLAVQLLIFTAASLIFLFGLRRWMKPVFTGNARAKDSYSEGMVGQEARVLTAILPDEAGRVELNGTTWKAEADEELEIGEAVVVVDHRSLTLVVKRK